MRANNQPEKLRLFEMCSTPVVRSQPRAVSFLKRPIRRKTLLSLLVRTISPEAFFVSRRVPPAELPLLPAEAPLLEPEPFPGRDTGPEHPKTAAGRR